MKFSKILSLCLSLALLSTGSLAMAQDTGRTPSPEAVQDTVAAVPEEEILTYEDYTVKKYSLTFYGGSFSGGRYLENEPLNVRTILTPEAYEIQGYDGEVLAESVDYTHYTGAFKEIESGLALGGRIGIYISDNFHLDLLGSYSSGSAITTMQETPDPENNPDVYSRVEVDRDDAFSVIKGGLALMYDAVPATFFGIKPWLGFGLGGVINSYSILPDVTALYLEGNFGLGYELIDRLSLGLGVDATIFSYEVPELGYSNMVNYYTYTLGLTWMINVVPEDVRAAHWADLEN
jgi:hypothetical protein